MSRRRHGNYHQGLILEMSPQVAAWETSKKHVRARLREGINSKQGAPVGAEQQCHRATHARAQWESWRFPGSAGGEHPVLLGALAGIGGMLWRLPLSC